jgi:lysophospholipase L1-like esterase
MLVLMCGIFAAAVFAQQPAQKPKPTLFIIGDSTVHNSSTGLQGWGDVIASSFDANRITVENRARGGRSSRTFQTEGLWDQVLAEVKAGDFVLIQFGHNDGGPINDATRARGSLRGVGPEAEEIDNLLTKKREVVHTFGWYMRKYIGAVVEFYPTKRIVTRFDAGDTMIHFRRQTITIPYLDVSGNIGIIQFTLPARTTHNFQFIAGVGFRF